MAIGHGHSNVAIDAPRATRRPFGGAARLACRTGRRHPGRVAGSGRRADGRSRHARVCAHRSSFELERPGDISDLSEPTWPDGIVPVPFRLGVDDEEVHAMIYAFWTDVPGHTDRPIDEWRSSILAGPWFDADLVVVAHGDDGSGPIVGSVLGRTFTGGVGWVSQLGVARIGSWRRSRPGAAGRVVSAPGARIRGSSASASRPRTPMRSACTAASGSRSAGSGSTVHDVTASVDRYRGRFLSGDIPSGT